MRNTKKRNTRKVKYKINIFLPLDRLYNSIENEIIYEWDFGSTEGNVNFFTVCFTIFMKPFCCHGNLAYQ